MKNIGSLCSELQLQKEFLIASLSLMGLSFLAILSMFYMILSKKKIGNYYRAGIQILLVIICKVFFIPIVLLMAQLIMENNISGLKGNDYFSLKTDFFKDESLAKAVGGVGLVWMALLAVLYEISHFDIKRKFDERLEFSKTNAKNSILFKVGQFVLCLISSFLSKDYYQVFLISCVLFYAFCCWSFLTTLPYYSDYVNILKTFTYLSLTSTGLFFIIGHLNNDPKMITITSLMMQPVIFIISILAVQKNKEKICNISKISNQSFFIFELSKREILKNSQSFEILLKINKNYKLNKVKGNRVICGYYCLDNLKNCTLALNLINKFSHKGLQFIINFQIFKLKKICMRSCKYQSLCLSIYRYIKRYRKILKYDQIFWTDFDKFFDDILRKDIKVHSLNISVSKLFKSWKNLERLYKSALFEFPQSIELKNMQQNFYESIQKSREDSKKLQKDLKGQNRNNFSELSKIINKIPLFLVSYDSKSIGQILFSNKKFSEAFNYNESQIENLNISSLFPNSIYKQILQEIKNLINKCEDCYLYKDKVMPMLDSGKFLIECIVTAFFITLDKKTSLIFSVRVKKRQEEIILVSELGVVLECSKGISDIIEIDREDFQNNYIHELGLEVDIEKINRGESHCVDIRGRSQRKSCKTVLISAENIKIKSLNFHLLYLNEKTNSNSVDEIVRSRKKTIINEKKMNSYLQEFVSKEEPIIKFSEPLDNVSRINQSLAENILINSKEKNSYNKSISTMRLTKIVLLILVIFN